MQQNLGDASEEQGERFHNDISIVEQRYQGRWDTHMMADYYWNLQRDCSETLAEFFNIELAWCEDQTCEAYSSLLIITLKQHNNSHSTNLTYMDREGQTGIEVHTLNLR
ncbi:hypothetical protein Trydic_g18063 [Trypoxylus dichotomus]